VSFGTDGVARMTLREDGSLAIGQTFSFATLSLVGPASGLLIEARAPSVGSTTVEGFAVQSNGDVRIQGRVNAAGDVDTNGKVSAENGFFGKCADNAPLPGIEIFCNQDVAETFATVEATEPGDLVTLVARPAAMPTVRRSTRTDTGPLVGVVSTSPGLVFDRGESRLAGDKSGLITPDRTVVGLVGRVPTKVSLENGPIVVGDPLTASSTPGIAMKATAPGQIVGYAMEPADQSGKILVHLQPGYYFPPAMLGELARWAPGHARAGAGDRYGSALSSAADRSGDARPTGEDR
jgi:hypothetical protein